MKKRLSIFKILLLICAVFQVAIYLMDNNAIRLYCTLISVAVFVYLFIETFQLASRVEDISLANGDLKQKLKKSEELRTALRETIEKNAAIREEQSEKIAKLQNDVISFEKRQSELQRDEAGSGYLNLFASNVVDPYLSYLKSIQLPLSESDKQIIIDKTIDLAMMAVDMADAYDWTINNREEQKLNLGILSGELTKSEAYEKALQITDNPTVTPKWIRAMSSALSTILSETNDIIYSGYKKSKL